MPVKVLQPTVQISKTKLGKWTRPSISFDLTIAIPNARYPDGSRPFAIKISECIAAPVKKYVTKDNPHGWHWQGPWKFRTRTDPYRTIFENVEMQELVLGFLNSGGYLKTAESFSHEQLDAKWRFEEDEPGIGGILTR